MGKQINCGGQVHEEDGFRSMDVSGVHLNNEEAEKSVSLGIQHRGKSLRYQIKRSEF